jgi:hypothetical protein
VSASPLSQFLDKLNHVPGPSDMLGYQGEEGVEDQDSRGIASEEWYEGSQVRVSPRHKSASESQEMTGFHEVSTEFSLAGIYVNVQHPPGSSSFAIS